MKPKIDASRLYVFDDLYEIYTQPNSISLYPISQLLGQFLNNTSLLLPNSSNCIITSLPLDFFISQSVNSSLSQSSFLYVLLQQYIAYTYLFNNSTNCFTLYLHGYTSQPIFFYLHKINWNIHYHRRRFTFTWSIFYALILAHWCNVGSSLFLPPCFLQVLFGAIFIFRCENEEKITC